MRQRIGTGFACAFALFTCMAMAARAEQPAPSPTPAAASDPVAVVQAFFDAINRHDGTAAAAVFTETPLYDGKIVCIAPDTCHTREEIAKGVYAAYIIYAPITVDLEQVGPTTVVARGQGDYNRLADTFFQGTFELAGDQIASYHADVMNTYCGDAPRKSVCPSFNPPPSIIYTPSRVLPSITPTVAASPAPSTAPMAAAATAPQATKPPTPQRGPTPVRTSGTAERLLLAALALVGVATLGLIVAAVGAVLRRRSPRVSRP